jgi:5-methylcytosine-specific restriction enzyme subunit McrC
MYQLLTYANEFDADEAWLIFPTLSMQLKAQQIEFCQPKETRFYLMPFEVTQGCLNLFH